VPVANACIHRVRKQKNTSEDAWLPSIPGPDGLARENDGFFDAGKNFFTVKKIEL
jgi:hypothetical protein